MKHVAVALVILVGCAHVAPPPLLGAPLPSPEVVASCKTKLGERTLTTFMGIGAGMGGSMSGAAAGMEESSNASGKLGWQLSAAGFGVIGAGIAITAAIINNAYNVQHCDPVLATATATP